MGYILSTIADPAMCAIHLRFPVIIEALIVGEMMSGKWIPHDMTRKNGNWFPLTNGNWKCITPNNDSGSYNISEIIGLYLFIDEHAQCLPTSSDYISSLTYWPWQYEFSDSVQ